MTTAPQSRTPTEQLGRQLLLGAAGGVAAGLAGAAGAAAAGYPDWSVTLWSLVTVVALTVLPLGLALRGLMHALHWLLERRRSPAYRQPVPDLYLTSYWPAYVVGAGAITAHLVLAVAFGLGTGRTWPF